MRNLHQLFVLCTASQIMVEISQNFLAFSAEYVYELYHLSRIDQEHHFLNNACLNSETDFFKQFAPGCKLNGFHSCLKIVKIWNSRLGDCETMI